MYAIVEASGKQYQLESGKYVDIDLVPFEPGQEYVFEQVLMIVDGKSSHIGAPYVSGAKVTGRVLAHGRHSKIIVYKQRPKKGTRKKQGHRQGYTRIVVDKISLQDKVLAETEKRKPTKSAQTGEPSTKTATKAATKGRETKEKTPSKPSSKAKSK